jgi:hydroxymethylbilane synthase
VENIRRAKESSVCSVAIGTRGSALALAQTSWIKEQILRWFPDTDVVLKIIKTSADRDTTASLRSASSVGVFVKELENALLAGDIDIAVHSMKDVPTRLADGLRIAAVPEREDARDALIAPHAQSLAELPSGSRIGTGSVRRQAQLLALRPDFRILDIRGNVDTRLKKLQDGEYDAVVLACAGLRRLGLEGRISAPLDFGAMLPAPGQGALAVEIRANDPKMETLSAALNHEPTAMAVAAERCFLQRMGGGCNIPVAIYARPEATALQIDALAASPDGRQMVRDSARTDIRGAEEAVQRLADRMLERGARAILDNCR